MRRGCSPAESLQHGTWQYIPGRLILRSTDAVPPGVQPCIALQVGANAPFAHKALCRMLSWKCRTCDSLKSLDVACIHAAHAHMQQPQQNGPSSALQVRCACTNAYPIISSSVRSFLHQAYCWGMLRYRCAEHHVQDRRLVTHMPFSLIGLHVARAMADCTIDADANEACLHRQLPA